MKIFWLINFSENVRAAIFNFLCKLLRFFHSRQSKLCRLSCQQDFPPRTLMVAEIRSGILREQLCYCSLNSFRRLFSKGRSPLFNKRFFAMWHVSSYAKISTKIFSTFIVFIEYFYDGLAHESFIIFNWPVSKYLSFIQA